MRSLAVGTVFALCSVVYAQAPDKLPEFEVATIKPVDPNVQHTMATHVYPGGKLVINSAPLKSLVFDAFNLAGWDLSGGEAWMESVQYHVEAKAPANWQSRIPDAQYSWYDIGNQHVREMLQALLIERFQLRFHRETKTGTVYVLTKSGKPLLLRPVSVAAPVVPEGEEPKDPPLSGNISRVSGRGWFLIYSSMPQLARRLSGTLHAPVLNQTDLDGYFNFESTDKQTEEDFKSDGTPALLSAIQEMGLQLTKTQGPVETFVIDRAEKPTPN